MQIIFTVRSLKRGRQHVYVLILRGIIFLIQNIHIYNKNVNIGSLFMEKVLQLMFVKKKEYLLKNK